MVLARFAGIRPAAVLPCRTADDVATALARARREGLAVVVRGGGHCFAGRSSTTGAVIDTSPMSGVRLDGDRAVIGAGTRLAEVYDRLAVAGRTIPAGCGPTVGIAGLTLGGGLGILGRRHGLTCDSLLGATVVLADGREVTAEEDLLWAMRGGGAPGVVTSLTFRTLPAPDSTAFRLTFRPESAAALIDAWQQALPGLDDALAPSLLITATSVGPWAPPRLTVLVSGAGPDGGSVDGLIRALGERPIAEARRRGTHRETKRWLAGDATTDSRFAYLHSEFFREAVPAGALIDRLTADPRPGEERELDFSPWGGAYNRVPADATAFPHRDARFLLKQTATAAAGDHPSPWLDDSYAVTHPSGTGGAYPNFPEPGLPPEAYHLANTARLQRIRAAYDPEALFTTP